MRFGALKLRVQVDYGPSAIASLAATRRRIRIPGILPGYAARGMNRGMGGQVAMPAILRHSMSDDAQLPQDTVSKTS